MNIGRSVRALVTILVIGALVFLASGRFGDRMETVEKVPYSKFLAMVREKPESPILEVTLEKDKIAGEYKKGGKFQTYVPEIFKQTEFLQKELAENNVRFDAQPSHLSDMLQGLLVSVLFPIGILALFWFFILRQAQSGGNQAMAFGRSRAKAVQRERAEGALRGCGRRG